jgi:hypothetical protein
MTKAAGRASIFAAMKPDCPKFIQPEQIFKKGRFGVTPGKPGAEPALYLFKTSIV